jgi:hypothetical protein
LTSKPSDLAAGPMLWEPSILPTLEAHLALIGMADEDGWRAEGGARRPAAPAGRAAAQDEPPPPPPSEAESKLAYAPPAERPEGEESPDVGDGAVGGVPAAAAADGCGLPAPEIAAARVEMQLQRVLESEAVQLPPWHISALLLMCSALLLTSLFSKHVPCGSWQFWVVQAAAVPVLLALAAAGRWDVLRKARVKKAAQVDWSGEIRWSRRNTLVFPAISVLAGVVAVSGGQPVLV